MKKINKLVLSIFFVGFLFTPIANFFGIDHLASNEAYAATKKKMSQKTFNKEAKKLSKKIKEYKSYIADNSSRLDGNRMINAKNFALLFEEETLGMSDEEELTYYLTLVSKFADREDALDEFFEQGDIDIISDFMYDIRQTNISIDKLANKIANYEKNYNSLVKEKKYEEAIKERKNQVKAYGQLDDKYRKAVNLEYNLYYETEDLFEELQDSDDDYDYNDDYGYDYEDDYYYYGY